MEGGGLPAGFDPAQFMAAMGAGGGVPGMPGMPVAAPNSGLPPSFEAGAQMPGGQQVPAGYRAVPVAIPMGWRGQKLPNFKEEEGWVSLYPLYLDSSRTSSQGRRLAMELCHEDPIAFELGEVVWNSCQIPCIVETLKRHPRQSTKKSGRLQIQLTKDGKPVNPLYPTKNAILRKCGEELGKLESRRVRLEKLREERAAKAKKTTTVAAAADSAASASSSSNKKKGKKKGRR